MDETKLWDFGDYPEISIDGVGDMQFINSQARLLLFRWRRIDAVWRPVVVATVAAPTEMINNSASIAPLIEKALGTVPQPKRDLLN